MRAFDLLRSWSGQTGKTETADSSNGNGYFDMWQLDSTLQVIETTYLPNNKESTMDNIDWQVGDRAYISGHPRNKLLSHGDIVRVQEIRNDRPCIGGDGSNPLRYLDNENRKPLRIAREGEMLPPGTKYLTVRAHSIVEGEVRSAYGLEVRRESYPYAIISFPGTKRDEILRRIENAERELAEAKAELGKS